MCVCVCVCVCVCAGYIYKISTMSVTVVSSVNLDQQVE